MHIDPKTAYFFNFRANIYYHLKDYPKALADYTTAIQINPKFADPYHNRGNASKNLLDYPLTFTDFTRAI